MPSDGRPPGGVRRATDDLGDLRVGQADEVVVGDALALLERQVGERRPTGRSPSPRAGPWWWAARGRRPSAPDAGPRRAAGRSPCGGRWSRATRRRRCRAAGSGTRAGPTGRSRTTRRPRHAGRRPHGTRAAPSARTGRRRFRTARVPQQVNVPRGPVREPRRGQSGTFRPARRRRRARPWRERRPRRRHGASGPTHQPETTAMSSRHVVVGRRAAKSSTGSRRAGASTSPTRRRPARHRGAPTTSRCAVSPSTARPPTSRTVRWPSAAPGRERLTDFGIGRATACSSCSGAAADLYAVAHGALKMRATVCTLFAAFGPEPIRARLELGQPRSSSPRRRSTTASSPACSTASRARARAARRAGRRPRAPARPLAPAAAGRGRTRRTPSARPTPRVRRSCTSRAARQGARRARCTCTKRSWRIWRQRDWCSICAPATSTGARPIPVG